MDYIVWSLYLKGALALVLGCILTAFSLLTIAVHALHPMET